MSAAKELKKLVFFFGFLKAYRTRKLKYIYQRKYCGGEDKILYFITQERAAKFEPKEESTKYQKDVA